MADLPAFCDSCGALFASPDLIGDAGRVHLQVRNIGVLCPVCGGSARIIDGSYEVIHDVVRQVQTEGWDDDRLLRLLDLLRAAADGPPDEANRALSEIRRREPALATAFKRDPAGWIAILIAVLLYLLGQSQTVHLSPEDLRQIERGLQQHVQTRPSR